MRGDGRGTIELHADLFAEASTLGDDEELLRAALNLLFLADVRYLLRNPQTPLLYSSGVRYVPEPAGQEEWQVIGELLRTKRGDCEGFGELASGGAEGSIRGARLNFARAV